MKFELIWVNDVDIFRPSTLVGRHDPLHNYAKNVGQRNRNTFRKIISVAGFGNRNDVTNFAVINVLFILRDA